VATFAPAVISPAVTLPTLKPAFAKPAGGFYSSLTQLKKADKFSKPTRD
jgi:hypothetical protein